MAGIGSQTTRKFTPPAWMRATLFLSALASIAGAVFAFRTFGWSVTFAGFVVFAALSAAGFADSLLCGVELRPESLVVVGTFRRREYPRVLFKRAAWAKGAPIALEYADGGWLSLPGYVGGGPGVLSIFRNWLGRTDEGT